MMRSTSLRDWAASIGSPSPYPHWVELHSLGKATYNGRVGRALAPPNDGGRVPVLLDGGYGELEPAGVKPISVRVGNLHSLVCLDCELVYAVRLSSGRNGPGNWCEVTVPRRHSCFAREQLDISCISDPTGGNRIEDINRNAWSLAFKSTSQLMEADVQAPFTDALRSSFYRRYTTIVSHLTGGPLWGGPPPLLSWHTTVTGEPLTDLNAEPLPGARWALIQRSNLLAFCGKNVALQRVSRPHSLDCVAMRNQPACYLMINIVTGFAPPHHMDGIGDAYVYESNEKGPIHFRLHDFEHIWDFINGDLACGEALAAGVYDVVGSGRLVDAFCQSRRQFDECRWA
jgi:hypothetical protein